MTTAPSPTPAPSSTEQRGLPLPAIREQRKIPTWVAIGLLVLLYGCHFGLATILVAFILESWTVAGIGLSAIAVGLATAAISSKVLNREYDERDADLNALTARLAKHYGITYITRPDLGQGTFNDPERQQLIEVISNDTGTTTHIVVEARDGRVAFLGPTDDGAEYPTAHRTT